MVSSKEKPPSKRKLAVSVHSYKGGTGKTSIASNLSIYLGQLGKRVLLVDMDFRAPSIQALFGVSDSDVKAYINDYLFDKSEIDHVVIHPSRLDLPVDVVLADSSPQSIDLITLKLLAEQWQMNSLTKVSKLKGAALNELGYDYVLFDTSPGVAHSSVNAMVSSDKLLLLTRMDGPDLIGTEKLIKGFYRQLQPLDPHIVVNFAFPSAITKNEDKEKTRRNLEKRLKYPVVSIIPCLCDVMLSKLDSLFILKNPDHVYTKCIKEISQVLL
jgi:MinD-like ATPase involved in chromosome partitioning or flagellar assembly